MDNISKNIKKVKLIKIKTLLNKIVFILLLGCNFSRSVLEMKGKGLKETRMNSSKDIAYALSAIVVSEDMGGLEVKQLIIEQLTTDVSLKVLRDALKHKIKEYSYGNIIHVWAENIIDNEAEEKVLINSILGCARVLEDEENDEDLNRERGKKRAKIINHRDRQGRTALLKLVMTLNEEGLKVLLDLGTEKNIKDAWSRGVEDYVGLWESYGDKEELKKLEAIKGLLGIEKGKDIGHMEALNMSRACGNKELFKRIYKGKGEYNEEEEKKILEEVVFGGWEDLFKEVIEGKTEEEEKYCGELAAYMGANIELEELLVKGGIKKRDFLKHGVVGGNVELVKDIIEGIKEERVEEHLFTAVKYKREEVLFELLKVRGVDVNAKDKDNSTALMQASRKGHEGVVEKLLEVEGIDVNAKDKCNNTALMMASEKGHEGVVEKLLEMEKIDVNAKDKDNITALMCASERGHEGVVEKLLEVEGIDVNAKNKDNNTAFKLALANSCDCVLKELIKVEGIEIYTKDMHRRTALIWASKQGHEGVVEKILKSEGINVNAKNEYNQTALMCALEKGHEGIVEKLLEMEGIEVNTKDAYGRTSLIMAMFKGREKIVEKLLEVEGTDVNAKDMYNSTALMWASARGHEGVVEKLLEVEGIDVNAKNKDNSTALMCASERGHEGVVEKLLKLEGINVDAKNTNVRHH